MKPQNPGSNAEEAKDIGSRLRIARTALNLGVRELGRRVGVSGSLISQIELGRAAPSVKTLYGITSALSLSLDDLFSPAHPFGAAKRVAPAHPAKARRNGPRVTVQRANSRHVLALGSGVRWEMLSTANDPPLEFQQTIYEAGGESAPEGMLMSHPGHEHGVVIEGTLDVTVDVDTFRLDTGDSISFDSGNPHRLFNSRDTRAVAIWAVVGREPGRTTNDGR